MQRSFLPRVFVLAVAAASLVTVPSALSLSTDESSPTPQAAAINGAFMEHLPAPAAPSAVCVVDTGVDLTADTGPIVTQRLTLNDDGLVGDMLAPAGHGTTVASVMGAPRNGTGSVGLWPHVRVVSVRATSKLSAGQATFAVSDYVRALRTCVMQPGVTVANFSVASPTAGIDVAPFESAVRDALAAYGVSVVAAAGNVPGAPQYPASASGVVAVAATDAGGGVCGFSASAPGILSAPGCGVEATGPGGDTLIWNGTSFAAPMVSSLLAALRGYRPDLTAAAAQDIVLRTAVSGPDGRSRRVDAEAAFRAAGLGALVDQATSATPASSRPASPSVRWIKATGGAITVRIAPLRKGTRLRVAGSGRFRQVDATTIRALPSRHTWTLTLRSVSPDGSTSNPKMIHVRAAH